MRPPAGAAGTQRQQNCMLDQSLRGIERKPARLAAGPFPVSAPGVFMEQ